MPKKTLGFSLLEFSMSMSIGLMLITIGLYAYQFLKREVICSHQQVERFIAALEIQQFLKNDLRWSGYDGNRAVWGCEASDQSCLSHLPQRSHARIKPQSQILRVYPSRSLQGHLAQSAQQRGVTYYLGLAPRFVGRHSKTFVLYRDDLSQNAEEIIAGIIDLTFAYQIQDEKGQRLSFRPASSLSDAQWLQVRGLRLKVQFEGGQTAIYEFSVPKWVCAGGSVNVCNLDQSSKYSFD